MRSLTATRKPPRRVYKPWIIAMGSGHGVLRAEGSVLRRFRPEHRTATRHLKMPDGYRFDDLPLSPGAGCRIITQKYRKNPQNQFAASVGRHEKPTPMLRHAGMLQRRHRNPRVGESSL